MKFADELRRRGVVRIGLAYPAFSWLLLQMADTIFPAIGLPAPALTLLLLLLSIGFLPALIPAWVFEIVAQTIDELDRVPGYYFLEPMLEPLRQDPRWNELMQGIGKSEEQRAAIEFPLVIPD